MAQAITSTNGMDDLTAFGSLANSGADLTNYTNELQKDREIRSLAIRRLKRSDVTGVLCPNFNYKPHTAIQDKLAAYSNVDLSQYPFLEPKIAIDLIQSNELQNIQTFSSNIHDLSVSSSVLLQKLSNSKEFLEVLTNNLFLALESNNPPLVVSLSAVTTIFLQITNEDNNMILIDSGLSLNLYDFLSSEDPNIIVSGLYLAESISSSSVYGRDSLLCYGIHSLIIELASKEEFSIPACSAILSIFSKFHCTDLTIVCTCIEPLAPLLSLPPPSSQLILNAFVEMTNCGPSIGIHIHKSNLFPLIVSFLSNEELAPTAIRLIGNLSVGQPFLIQSLLDSNLIPLLLPLIENPSLTADVIWVLCNAIESFSSPFVDLFTSQQFLIQILNIANEGGIDDRREASYLIATIVIFGGEAIATIFKTIGKYNELASALVEMLGCGIEPNVKRCQDAILQLILLENGNEIIAALEENDIRQRCVELEENDSLQIVQGASYLLNLLDKLENQ